MLKTNKLLFFLNIAIISAIVVVLIANAWNSPNNNPPYSTNQAIYISPTGNVGIGTTAPTQKLDVNGVIKATSFSTGDLLFNKGDKLLWRMFEEEDGLYLESQITKKIYKIWMEKVK